MYIAKLSLICLVAFSFMVGCGMMGKKADMPEANTTSIETKEVETVKSESVETTTADTVEADALAEDTIQEVTLNVTGMTWGGCTSKVQAALSQVAGVSEVVSVSSATNTAVVKVEKGKVTNAALTSAVEGAGFTAKVAE